MAPKKVIVTGANRGLGLAVCKNLIEHNHYIIATSRSNEGIEELKSAFSHYPEKLILKLDVSDAESIKRFAQIVKDKYERIDCLINNAGIFSKQNAKELSIEELQKSLNTNLIGPFLISQQVIPLLSSSSSPKIINVSSQMGSIENTGAGYAAYRITKTALNSLTRNIHFEYIDKGISTYAVCPGWVHTDMGGPNAPRTPEEGASSILFPFYNNAESGSFLQDGKKLNW